MNVFMLPEHSIHVHTYMYIIRHISVFPPRGDIMTLPQPLILKFMSKNTADQTSCTTDALHLHRENTVYTSCIIINVRIIHATHTYTDTQIITHT